jgi:uncharacterized protein
MPRVRLLENHFPIAGAVPLEDLVGRRDEAELMTARALSGQHSYLAGPRRIGKSSVAEAALSLAAREGAIAISADLLYLTTPMAFASVLFDKVAVAQGGAAGMLQALRQKQKLLDVESTYLARLGPFFEAGIRIHEAAEAPDMLLNRCFELLGQLAEVKDRRVVLLLDEFQDSGRIHSAFDDSLRHFAADRKHRVSYLFSGSRASILAKKFGDRQSPLFRVAMEVPIRDPQPAEWIPYLDRKLREVGIQADEHCLAKLLEESGGHAQDTMALAAELHLLMFARQQHFAGYGEAEEALLRALNGLATPFGQDWESLLTREQLAIARIAHGARVFAGLAANDSEAVRRALNRLREDGVVVKEGGGRYSLREPLFAAYLRRTVPLP